jgi:hypothetical protein
MVNGELMPRPPEILASLIAITIVSRVPLPKNWLKNTFRVRRAAVRTALNWCRDNNPKYYGNITISEEHLAMLPDDDVPHQILDTVRQESNDMCLNAENDTYVPEVDGDDVVQDSTNNGPDPGEWRF